MQVHDQAAGLLTAIALCDGPGMTREEVVELVQVALEVLPEQTLRRMVNTIIKARAVQEARAAGQMH